MQWPEVSEAGSSKDKGKVHAEFRGHVELMSK